MPALRVLLIEDDPAVLETFSEALHRAGLKVEATPTVAGALELLVRRRPFHAIVADLRLRDASPFDTLAALRAAAPDSRIVVCSGVTPEQLVEAVAPGQAA